MNEVARSRRDRPKWTRFARAAARSLSRDIYACAVKAGVDVNFVPGSTSGPNAGGGSSSMEAGSTPFSYAGDGSKEEVYNCLRGLVNHLQLSEQETGLILMITYGLMKAEDLQPLPTTWRMQLMAALRCALLHGIQDRAIATATAAKLQTYMELWRPGWRNDYDVFTSRAPMPKLMEAAMLQAKLLRQSNLYMDETWEETSPPPAEECEDVASI